MGISFNISNGLLLNSIDIIFSAHLKCLENSNCDKCILNEARVDGHRIGCLKLRDMAMQKVIDAYGNKGNNNG